MHPRSPAPDAARRPNAAAVVPRGRPRSPPPAWVGPMDEPTADPRPVFVMGDQHGHAVAVMPPHLAARQEAEANRRRHLEAERQSPFAVEPDLPPPAFDGPRDARRPSPPPGAGAGAPPTPEERAQAYAQLRSEAERNRRRAAAEDERGPSGADGFTPFHPREPASGPPMPSRSLLEVDSGERSAAPPPAAGGGAAEYFANREAAARNRARAAEDERGPGDCNSGAGPGGRPPLRRAPSHRQRHEPPPGVADLLRREGRDPDSWSALSVPERKRLRLEAERAERERELVEFQRAHREEMRAAAAANRRRALEEAGVSDGEGEAPSPPDGGPAAATSSSGGPPTLDLGVALGPGDAAAPRLDGADCAAPVPASPPRRRGPSAAERDDKQADEFAAMLLAMQDAVRDPAPRRMKRGASQREGPGGRGSEVAVPRGKSGEGGAARAEGDGAPGGEGGEGGGYDPFADTGEADDDIDDGEDEDDGDDDDGFEDAPSPVPSNLGTPNQGTPGGTPRPSVAGGVPRQLSDVGRGGSPSNLGAAPRSPRDGRSAADLPDPLAAVSAQLARRREEDTSLAAKVEALRVFLDDTLGTDRFHAARAALEACGAADLEAAGAGATDGARGDNDDAGTSSRGLDRVHAALGPENAYYLRHMFQLLQCEALLEASRSTRR